MEAEVTTKKKNKVVFRVGDSVKVINSTFFLRCGYPLSFQEVKEDVRGKYANKINSFIRAIKDEATGRKIEDPYKSDIDFITLVSFPTKEYLTEKILGEVAYCVLRHKNYGGTKRTVHTVEIPELKNMEFIVTGKKVCYSGEYERGGGSSYDGDYDPNYLGNAKAHIILSLAEPYSGIFCGNGFEFLPRLNRSFMDKLKVHGKNYPLAIESCNVEKINKE
jgi:hypothetical protein